MEYIKVGELRELIKDAPDNTEIHFAVFKTKSSHWARGEYYKLLTTLKMPNELREGFSLSLRVDN